MREPVKPLRKRRLAPFFFFAFCILCTACLAIGSYGLVKDWRVCVKIFLSILAGPCGGLTNIGSLDRQPLDQLFLAAISLIPIGIHITRQTKGSAIGACIGMGIWFLWGMAITFVGY